MEEKVIQINGGIMIKIDVGADVGAEAKLNNETKLYNQTNFNERKQPV